MLCVLFALDEKLIRLVRNDKKCVCVYVYVHGSAYVCLLSTLVRKHAWQHPPRIYACMMLVCLYACMMLVCMYACIYRYKHLYCMQRLRRLKNDIDCVCVSVHGSIYVYVCALASWYIDCDAPENGGVCVRECISKWICACVCCLFVPLTQGTPQGPEECVCVSVYWNGSVCVGAVFLFD
jgi:hypothetical protein